MSVVFVYLTWAVQVKGRVATSNYSPGRHVDLTNSCRLHRKLEVHGESRIIRT